MLNVVIKDITFDESYYLKLSKEMLPDIIIEIFEGYEFEEI